jgi:hypothetical protein
VVLLVNLIPRVLHSCTSRMMVRMQWRRMCIQLPLSVSLPLLLLLLLLLLLFLLLLLLWCRAR